MFCRLFKEKLYEKLSVTDQSITKDMVFLDSDDLPKISVLIRKVKSSKNVVFILTKGVLSRPWCLLELVTAIRDGKNIIPVRLMNQTRGFDFEQAGMWVSNLCYMLEEMNPGAIGVLKNVGVEIEEAQDAVKKLLDVVAVEVNTAFPERVLNAQFEMIVEKLV